MHFTRGESLAEFLRWYVDSEVREWLDEHADDGEPPHPLFPDNLHFLRHVEWRKRRFPFERRLLQQLKTGELVATGYQVPMSIVDKRQAIPREMWEVLEPDFYNSAAEGEGLKIIKIEVMEAPLPGSVPYVPRADRKLEDLVELSEDSRVLRIDNERYLFRGNAQPQVIRRLYNTFVTGTPELTQVLLSKAGVRCSSIAQVFRGYSEWQLLRRHIRTTSAFSWLEPKIY